MIVLYENLKWKLHKIYMDKMRTYFTFNKTKIFYSFKQLKKTIYYII